MQNTQSKIKLNIQSETGFLKEVILGLASNFHQSGEVELVNAIQQKYYGTDQQPTIDKLQKEFNSFEQILRSHGVIVHYPQPVKGVCDQLPPRDIGMVIGDQFIVSSMRKKSRQREYEGIKHLFSRFNKKPLFVPEEIVLECGDVLIDGRTIFVGMSQRTGKEGVEWLQTYFGKHYDVVPCELCSLNQGEDVLHLDCTFNLFGNKHAVIYKEGFKKIPPQIKNNYTLIEVTKHEQEAPILGTNFLSISPQLVLVSDSPLLNDLNKKIEATGVNVVKITFDEAPKTGCSFRCCSLPLYRN